MESKRIYLRDMQSSDLDEMLVYLSDEEVMRYEKEPFDREGLSKIIEKYSGKGMFYVVIHQKTKKLIGHVYIGVMNPKENDEYNLGYIFNPLYHNMGYCTEACKLIVEFAFSKMNVRRIQAVCNPENIASWRVMEKVGLNREGLLKNKASLRKDKNGNPIFTDQLIYGLINENYSFPRNMYLRSILNTKENEYDKE